MADTNEEKQPNISCADKLAESISSKKNDQDELNSSAMEIDSTPVDGEEGQVKITAPPASKSLTMTQEGTVSPEDKIEEAAFQDAIENHDDVINTKKSPKQASTDITTTTQQENKGAATNNDDGFVVLEEDDTDDDGEGRNDTSESAELSNVPEGSVEGSTADADLRDQVKIDSEISVKAEANMNSNTTDADINNANDDDVILINPLFRKNAGKSGGEKIPVYDVDSHDSSSESESGLDFTSDVNLNQSKSWCGINGQTNETIGEACGCNCFYEKGILVNEIERLRKAMFELSERHSVLEDFIEVEYGERFDKFLRNREHLVQMGFGHKNDSSDAIIDGKRSSKSSEMVELLKMIKEQADTSATDGKCSGDKEKSIPDDGFQRPSSQSKTSPPKNTSKQSSVPAGKQQYLQKSKPIPSVTSSRSSGTSSYQKRPILLAPSTQLVQSHVPVRDLPTGYQYHFPSSSATANQSHYYYDSMYSNVTGSGLQYAASNNGRELIRRNDLYPSSTYAHGYNAKNLDGTGSGYNTTSRKSYSGTSEESRESKKQRKRKRRSEASETGSTTTSSSALKSTPNNNISSSSKSKSQPISVKNSEVAGPEMEPGDSVSLNPSSKRTCPVCSKVLNRKQLRDHLITHQGFEIKCPVCKLDLYQRRKLTLHLRDVHEMPATEYAVYVKKIYENIEIQIGTTLNKLVSEAKIPTKQQMVEWAESMAKVMAGNSKVQETTKAPSVVKSSTSTNTTAGNSARPSGQKSGNSGSSGKGGESGRSSKSRNQFQQQSQPTRRGGSRWDTTSDDLYGPGGYAQYAARYLQERSSAPANRLYTPF